MKRNEKSTLDKNDQKSKKKSFLVIPDGNLETIILEGLFPVLYDGKLWFEDDCDDVFLAFYSHPCNLNDEGGVYMSGDWIYPDGEIEED